MAKYPEHEKLLRVRENSQIIGEFLDFGLPEQGLILFERHLEPCQCEDCRAALTRKIAGIHADATEVREGSALYARYRPTGKHIPAILAEYFDIDEDKLEAEKRQTLDEIRAAQ